MTFVKSRIRVLLASIVALALILGLPLAASATGEGGAAEQPESVATDQAVGENEGDASEEAPEADVEVTPEAVPEPEATVEVAPEAEVAPAPEAVAKTAPEVELGLAPSSAPAADTVAASTRASGGGFAGGSDFYGNFGLWWAGSGSGSGRGWEGTYKNVPDLAGEWFCATLGAWEPNYAPGYQGPYDLVDTKGNPVSEETQAKISNAITLAQSKTSLGKLNQEANVYAAAAATIVHYYTTAPGDLGTYSADKVADGIEANYSNPAHSNLTPVQAAQLKAQYLAVYALMDSFSADSNPTAITLSALPDKPVAGEGVQVTATLKNSKGAPAAGAKVAFSTTDGTLSAASAVSDVNGQAKVTLTLALGQDAATVTASTQEALNHVDMYVPKAGGSHTYQNIVALDTSARTIFAKASVTRTKIGGFSLSKALEGIDPGLFPEDTVFDVTASWTVGEEEVTQDFQLPLDGTVVAGPQDLPVGTVVTFTEVEAPQVEGYEWMGVTIAPESVTIGDGVDAKVVATNTYRELVGGFSLSKALEGIDPGLFPEDTVFDVTASWTVGEEEVTQDFQLPLDGTVVAGPQDLPEGTVVTFTEVEAPQVEGYEWMGVTIAPESVTIADGVDAAVVATNTYRELVGGFSLSKELKGITASEFPEGTVFDVTASWTVGEEEVTQDFQLPVDGTVVAGPQDLPEGTVVTFTEVKAPQVEGYSWTGVTFTPKSVTIADGVDAKVVATNAYRELVGGFSLSKELKGIKASQFPKGTVFEVTASWTVDGEKVSQKYQLPLDGTVVAGPQDLPEGTVVTFTEVEAPQVEGYSWTGVTFTPKSVTIADGVDAKVVATNAYRGELASTGALGTAGFAILGLVTLAGGTGLLVARRRMA